MGATVEWAGDFDQVVLDAARPQLSEVAEQIASDAEAGFEFPGARSKPVEVTETDKGYRVAAQGPFAHLEEWGGARSAAKAPMRRAAEASGGTFQEA